MELKIGGKGADRKIMLRLSHLRVYLGRVQFYPIKISSAPIVSNALNPLHDRFQRSDHSSQQSGSENVIGMESERQSDSCYGCENETLTGKVIEIGSETLPSFWGCGIVTGSLIACHFPGWHSYSLKPFHP